MGYFELRKYVKKIQAEGYDVTKYLCGVAGENCFSSGCLDHGFYRYTFFHTLGAKRRSNAKHRNWYFYRIFILDRTRVCMSLGRSEMLPIFIAAWGANILFGAAAALLFYKVHT